MTDPNPWTDPETLAYLRRATDELAPKIRESAMVICSVPEPARLSDLQFATQLGLAILMDKPILALVTPGTPVPAHVVRVADRIVEMDLDGDAEANQRQLEATMAEIDAEYGITGP